MSVKISFSFATYVKRLFYGHMFSVLLPEKLGNLDLQCRKKERHTQCIHFMENQSEKRLKIKANSYYKMSVVLLIFNLSQLLLYVI